MRLLVFGFGYSARALVARTTGDVRVTATVRTPLPDPWRDRVETVSVQADDALATALRRADALLVTAAPDPETGLCPGFEALAPHLAPGSGPGWIGYLSTTGVYGDRGGRWVRETSRTAPASETSRRRVAAEAAWASTGRPLAVFRLPGIYGPGRSALDRVREGTARRMAAPRQVFSRIPVDDLADGLPAPLARPDRTGLFTLCDDEPAPAAPAGPGARPGLLGRARGRPLRAPAGRRGAEAWWPATSRRRRAGAAGSGRCRPPGRGRAGA